MWTDFSLSTPLCSSFQGASMCATQHYLATSTRQLKQKSDQTKIRKNNKKENKREEKLIENKTKRKKKKSIKKAKKMKRNI